MKDIFQRSPGMAGFGKCPFCLKKKLLQGGAVLDSGENMHFIVSRVKAIKSKSEESESHGWVKLEFYDNKGEGETDWLPILSETASNGCGFWSLPETGVQALACIFDGTKSGFVIGFLYDEKHKPPVKENEKACDRTILQTKNHRFELVDEEGKETISISTSKGKMRVVLASDGGIEIANKMKKGKIEIEAEELEIESENLILDEYSTSIEAGVLEITNSNSVSLNTKKDFKVKGKNVKLNGSTGVTAKGRQIAKQDDKVIGVDTHILMVPSPSGAVPTPFSHPFVGALKEDLAASVKIGNNKVATKNSVAKHLAGHVPMGPGPFQKTPDNKGKVTGGTEKSVKANGKEVAVIGSSVTTCNDIGARNNSKIFAVGMAINMPAIADPMKSEAYERERKQTEKESKQAEKNLHKFQEKAERLIDEQINKIKGGEIRKKTGGLYNPAKISVVIDMKTNKYYYGYNGANELNLSYDSNLHPELKKMLENTKQLAKNAKDNEFKDLESFEPWKVDNCAEVYAVNQALKAGSKKEDLFIATKRFRQNDTAPPCKNCVITFKDCKFLK